MQQLALLMLVAGQAAPQAALQVYQDKIVVARGKEEFTQPLSAAARSAPVGKFRKGQRFAVWDERGLSVRDGDWLFTTKLAEVAVTPKLFTSEQIKETLAKAGAGERMTEAAALSGAGRVGDQCYFLVRWNEKSGKSWLEALMRVDLSVKHPKPQLLGRFEGLSLSEGAVDDRLFMLGKMPSALTRVQEDWGLASYDPDAGTFGFAKLGERLRAHAILDVKGAVYVEALAYGPLRMGMVDFASGWRSDLFEARGHLRILDSKQPICAVIGSDQRSLLRNIREGAQAEFPTGTAYARTPMGILAWWPREQPIGAALLDPKRMERLATWSGRPAVDASKQPAAAPARSRA